MRSFRFAAVLFFSFLSTFLLGQIADNNSSTQPANENVTTLTGRLNANGSALPQPAGEGPHLYDPLRPPSSRVRATLDLSGVELPSLPNDPRPGGDPRFTVSVSSLAAPEKARKAFNKGQQDRKSVV